MPVATNAMWIKRFGRLPWWRNGASVRPKVAVLSKGPHSFAATQLDLPNDLQARLRAWVQANVAREDLSPDEAQDDAFHVTVLYGLKTDQHEVIRQFVEGTGLVRIELGAVAQFDKSPDYDVLIVPVVKEAGLRALRTRLTDQLPWEATQDGYAPHVTLAYVRKGAGRRHLGAAAFLGETATLDRLRVSDSRGETSWVSLLPVTKLKKANGNGRAYAAPIEPLKEGETLTFNPETGERGVWRNVGGRSVFIAVKKGESVPEAVKRVDAATSGDASTRKEVVDAFVQKTIEQLRRMPSFQPSAQKGGYPRLGRRRTMRKVEEELTKIGVDPDTRWTIMGDILRSLGRLKSKPPEKSLALVMTPHGYPLPLAREPTRIERKVDFATIVLEGDRLQAQAVARVKTVLTNARDKLLALVERKHAAGELTAKFVLDLELRGLGQLVPTLREALGAFFRFGQRTAEGELLRGRAGVRLFAKNDLVEGPSGKLGVWRTIRGRRVFIEEGQSLEEALSDSSARGSDGGDAVSKTVALWKAERRVGDIKGGPRLGEFFSDNETTANNLSGGSGRVERREVRLEKPLTIPAKTGLDFEFYDTVELNALLKSARVKYRFSDGEDQEVWRHVDDGGLRLVRALKKAGYDSIQFPEFLGGKEQITTLIFDPANKTFVQLKALIDAHPDWGRARLKAVLTGNGKAYQVKLVPEGLPPEAALEFFERKASLWATDVRGPLLQSAKAVLFDAIKRGAPLRETMAMLEQVFLPWLGDEDALRGDGDVTAPFRLETLVRTNTNESFNEGRKAQFQEEVDSGFVIGFQFSAIIDSRTTPVCAFLDEKIFRTDSPELDRLTPPRHFGCRSILSPVLRTEGPVTYITPRQVARGIDLSGAGFAKEAKIKEVAYAEA